MDRLFLLLAFRADHFQKGFIEIYYLPIYCILLSSVYIIKATFVSNGVTNIVRPFQDVYTGFDLAIPYSY